MSYKNLTLDEQFDFYLESVHLDKAELPRTQLTELKRAFAGGMSQMVALVLGDDMQTIEYTLGRITNELVYFWNGEAIKHECKF